MARKIIAADYKNLLDEIVTELKRRGKSDAERTAEFKRSDIILSSHADDNIIGYQSIIKYSTKPVLDSEIPQRGTKILERFYLGMEQFRDDVKYNHTCQSCIGNCISGCSGACIGNCKDSCYTGCTGDCLTSCHQAGCCSSCNKDCRTNGCSGHSSFGSCGGSAPCKAECVWGCGGNCTNIGCANNCGGNCTNGCSTKCSTGCKGGCKTDCNTTCQNACSLSCGSGCSSMARIGAIS